MWAFESIFSLRRKKIIRQEIKHLQSVILKKKTISNLSIPPEKPARVAAKAKGGWVREKTAMPDDQFLSPGTGVWDRKRNDIPEKDAKYLPRSDVKKP